MLSLVDGVPIVGAPVRFVVASVKLLVSGLRSPVLGHDWGLWTEDCGLQIHQSERLAPEFFARLGVNRADG